MIRIRFWTWLVLLFPISVIAEERDFAQWEKEITAIEARDAKSPPELGTTVFVGSSSIRLWSLDKSFPKLRLVNHGFGGSTVADSVHFVDRLVLKLKPKLVVFYAGDNDLAIEKTPKQVLADFRAFIDAVHAELPETKIIYLPIKPSPARWHLYAQQQAANKMIAETLAQDKKRLVYLDLVTPMLDDDGEPRGELFRDDRLHLNDDGYALWSKLLAPHLSP